MAFVKFRTFAGGELDPALHSRTDLVKYQTGAKTLRNIIVRKSGGIANRAGTTFVRETIDNLKTRLFFSNIEGNSYVIEFTALKFKTFKNGVAQTSGVHPYSLDEVYELDYAINGINIYFAHKNHDLRVLQYRAWVDAWVFTIASINSFSSFAIGTSPAITFTPTFAGGTTTYKYAFSKIENGEEWLPFYAQFSTGPVDIVPSEKIKIQWTEPATSVDKVYYKIFREIGGVYGLVGVCKITSSATNAIHFWDLGVTPDTTITPVSSEHFFQPSAGETASTNGNRPSVIANYQQRMFLASTKNNNSTVYGSELGTKKLLFTKKNYVDKIKDTDAFDFSIYSTRSNAVNYLADVNGLVVFTENSEWATPRGEALTPLNIPIQKHTSNGCKKGLKPISLNDSALYVHKNGGSIREIGYSYQIDGYTGDDISAFAGHLFRGKTIVSWDYQRTPDSILWVVFNDGTVASMTYIKEQQIMAWTHHDFFGGKVLSVGVSDENLNDVVYFVTERVVGGTTKRYIEKLSQRDFTDFSNQIFTDCTWLYDGYSAASPAGKLTISGTTYLDDDTLNLDVENSFFASSHIGEEIHFQSSEGLIRLEILSIDIDPKKATAFILNKPELPSDVRSVQISSWALAKKNFSGVSHLPDGKVSVVADGYVLASPNNPNYDAILCTSGAVTLPTAHIMVQIGLPITSDFETLAIDSSEVNLSVENKLVRSVNIDFRNSKGGFVGTELPAGNGIENLIEVKPRSNENYESATALKSEMIAINTLTAWDRNGSAVFRQVDPLPFEITSVIPQVTMGAKR